MYALLCSRCVRCEHIQKGEHTTAVCIYPRASTHNSGTDRYKLAELIDTDSRPRWCPNRKTIPPLCTQESSCCELQRHSSLEYLYLPQVPLPVTKGWTLDVRVEQLGDDDTRKSSVNGPIKPKLGEGTQRKLQRSKALLGLADDPRGSVCLWSEQPLGSGHADTQLLLVWPAIGRTFSDVLLRRTLQRLLTSKA